MKKLFLIIIIVLCGTFIYLKLQVLGNENSGFNQTTRFTLGKYSFARSALGLHNDGDAREWYLKGAGPLIIEVVQAQNVVISEKALYDFAAAAKKYSGRDTEVYSVDYVKNGILTDADISEIIKTSRRHVLPGQPNFFVIFAEDFKRDGTELARTVKEFGMVMSDVRLKELVGSSGGTAREQYIESTMLHEFGHQLGLGHNSSDGCIMNERVEKPQITGEFFGQYTPTVFCDNELQELQIIKETIK